MFYLNLYNFFLISSFEELKIENETHITNNIEQCNDILKIKEKPLQKQVFNFLNFNVYKYIYTCNL